MEEERKDQLIQGYLDGTLTTSDRQDFEKQVQTDPDLAAELREYQDLVRGLHGIGAEQFAAEVSQWESDYQEKQATSRKVLPFRRYYSVAAAVAVLIIAGIFLFRTPEPSLDQLYSEIYEPYEDMILDRSNTEAGIEAQLIAGMEAYNRKDYSRAEEHLRAYRTAKSEEYGPALYLGIAQLETGQYAAAEASFEEAEKDPHFAQQAQWYRSLLFVKSKQYTKARAALQPIADNPQHYKHPQAEALLSCPLLEPAE